MPRVFSKTKNRAGKQYTCHKCGRIIRPGEKYFSYSFRYGGTYRHCSNHYPKRSDLTQSLMGEVYVAIEDAEDRVKAEIAYPADLNLYDFDPDDIENTATEIVSSVEDSVTDVIDRYREADEAFGGYGSTPNAERADELESFQSELNSFAVGANFDPPDKALFHDDDEVDAEDLDPSDLSDPEGYEDEYRDSIEEYLEEVRGEIETVFSDCP